MFKTLRTRAGPDGEGLLVLDPQLPKIPDDLVTSFGRRVSALLYGQAVEKDAVVARARRLDSVNLDDDGYTFVYNAEFNMTVIAKVVSGSGFHQDLEIAVTIDDPHPAPMNSTFYFTRERYGRVASDPNAYALSALYAVTTAKIMDMNGYQITFHDGLNN